MANPSPQVFKGTTYYWCGKYYQRDGVRLHRAIWQDYHGDIPTGMHVHHIDHDRTNNSVENLALMSASAHMSHHQQDPNRVTHPITPQALKAAAEWHRSEEGRAWHRRHYKKMAAKFQQQIKLDCEFCGETFTAKDTKRNRFCSNGCKTKWRYRSGVDNETRCCLVCQGDFVINRYQRNVTCSRACGAKLRGMKRRSA